MKRKLKKQIEENASNLEEKALSLINYYGPQIRDKRYWEHGIKQRGGINTYIPPGGNHPKPKPRENFNGPGQPDSPEYLIMKEFLNKYPQYDTRNTKSVRNWYGL